MSHGVDYRLISELSESQRQCLRLVLAGRTSKQIARLTGLSSQTVDQYMSRAAARLGAANRHQAAQILAITELREVQEFEFRSRGLASISGSAATMAAPVDAEQAEQDANGGYADPPSHRTLAQLVRLPPVGGEHHDFDWTKRTKAILYMAFAALVAVSGLIVLVRGAILLLKA